MPFAPIPRFEVNVLLMKNLFSGWLMKMSVGFCQPPERVRNSFTPKSSGVV